ncbi:MAG: hypothetical protein ACOZAM_22055 [Pseudomonadota bacterium]
MIEDQEVYDDLWEASDFVDRISADMPGFATYRDPAVSGRLFG